MTILCGIVISFALFVVGIAISFVVVTAISGIIKTIRLKKRRKD